MAGGKLETLRVTATTNLEQLNEFLSKGGENDKVFGTKPAKGRADDGVIATLYLSPKASGSRELNHDRLHATQFRLHRRTACEHISAILYNAINKLDEAPKAKDEDNRSYRKDLSILLNGVASRKVIFKPQPDGCNLQEEKSDPHYTRQEMLAKDVAKTVETFQKTTFRAEEIDRGLVKMQPISTGLPASKSKLIDETKNLTFNGVELACPSLEIDGNPYVAQKVMGEGGFGIAVRYRQVDGAARKIVKLPKGFQLSSWQLGEKSLQEQKTATAQEFNRGLRFGKGDMTLPFKDHVALKNGMIALIGDLAEHGDLFDFTLRLKKNVEEKKLISPHAHCLVALTMTLDSGESLASIHRAGGIHGDVKPENHVLDAKGRTKMIDFGLAEPGPTVSNVRGQKHAFDCDDYNAPEAAKLDANEKKNKEQVDIDAQVRVHEIKKEFIELFELDPDADALPNDDHDTADGVDTPVGGTIDASQKMAVRFTSKYDELFENAAHANEADKFSVSAKADVYGIGVTAYTIAGLTTMGFQRERQGKTGIDGKPQIEKDPKRVALQRKIALADDAFGHGINLGDGVPFANHAIVAKVNDPVMDLLLDDLLNPNPELRINVEQVQKHVTMDYAKKDNAKAVGSPEVRALILAIAEDDEGKITLAANALQEAFPEPTDKSKYREELDTRARKFADLNPPEPVVAAERVFGKASSFGGVESIISTSSSMPATASHQAKKDSQARM